MPGQNVGREATSRRRLGGAATALLSGMILQHIHTSIQSATCTYTHSHPHYLSSDTHTHYSYPATFTGTYACSSHAQAPGIHHTLTHITCKLFLELSHAHSLS